jgi:hypothetical protein
MVRSGGYAQPERLSQLRYRVGPLGQETDNLQAIGIGQGLEEFQQGFMLGLGIHIILHKNISINIEIIICDSFFLSRVTANAYS